MYGWNGNVGFMGISIIECYDFYGTYNFLPIVNETFQRHFDANKFYSVCSPNWSSLQFWPWQTEKNDRHVNIGT